MFTDMLQWLREALDFAPPSHFLNWRPDMVTLHAASDVLIATGYLAICIGIIWLLFQRPDLSGRYRALGFLLVLFCLTGVVNHGISASLYWQSLYGVQGLAKVGTVVVAILMLAFTLPLLPRLARLPSPRQLAEANESLRREVGAHQETLKELGAIQRELEERVADRTRELSLVKARFETALRGAKVYVFSQDRELRYNWAYNPRGEDVAASILGHTDSDIVSTPDREMIIATKLRVLGSGQPEDAEVSYMLPEGRVIFALHIEPTLGPDGQIDGIMCAAVDVTRLRTLEREQRRLMEELATNLQRYELGMQSSNVTVFTQDRDLRYTSISKPMFGKTVNEIIGRTDEEVLPSANRLAIIGAKREVLKTGQSQKQEMKVVEQVNDTEIERWYVLNMDALRDISGAIVGLTTSSVDITERMAAESHLRMLMHELTHRSKNLLAVIQAMAHQTGRQAGSISRFLDRFGERLQALAKSHDILVQEDWHGASLVELVRSQLGHYLDQSGSQISIKGPSLQLKPEGAQALGLALHELATNASKYGALSVQSGRVSVDWKRIPTAKGGGLELVWQERGGPKVEAPKTRGFGSLVIERNLARSMDADVKLEFLEEGVSCRVQIPEEHILSTAAAPERLRMRSAAGT
jgi:two-component sensor histidine kinase/PAS domain-containing protein